MEMIKIPTNKRMSTNFVIFLQYEHYTIVKIQEQLLHIPTWIYLTVMEKNVSINYVIFKNIHDYIKHCLMIHVFLNKTIKETWRYDKHQNNSCFSQGG